MYYQAESSQSRHKQLQTDKLVALGYFTPLYEAVHGKVF